MFTSVLSQVRTVFINIEKNIVFVLGSRHPPDTLCVLGTESLAPTSETSPAPQLSLPDLLRDSVLWAVPKHRRTVEKRLQRKFGWPALVWKPIVPKKNLLMCQSCGDHHIVGHLCCRTSKSQRRRKQP
uniref:Large ribosomal subunit protein bL32m n=1 Tax=Graphocephala atropunctata TaxID=36148 RepID=A0A1B6L2F5_9HEMI